MFNHNTITFSCLPKAFIIKIYLRVHCCTNYYFSCCRSRVQENNCCCMSQTSLCMGEANSRFPFFLNFPKITKDVGVSNNNNISSSRIPIFTREWEFGKRRHGIERTTRTTYWLAKTFVGGLVQTYR